MRERDMRARVERFIQTRLRSMLFPATLGLGMALTGCKGDGLEVDDGGGSDAIVNQQDAQDAGAAMKYIAPIPDAAPDLSGPAPEYIAPTPKADSGVAVRYMAQMPDAGMVALYMAPLP
jgi:hypothetical protein